MSVPLVSEVAVPAFHVVGNEVLAGGNNTLVLVFWFALKSFDEGVDVARKMVWVFSWRFLSTTPSAVLKAVEESIYASPRIFQLI